MTAARFEPYVMPDVAAGMMWAVGGASAPYATRKAVLTEHGDLRPPEAAAWLWLSGGGAQVNQAHAALPSAVLRDFIRGLFDGLATNRFLEDRAREERREVLLQALLTRCRMLAVAQSNDPDEESQRAVAAVVPYYLVELARESSSYKVAVSALPTTRPATRTECVDALAAVPYQKKASTLPLHVPLLNALKAKRMQVVTRSAGELLMQLPERSLDGSRQIALRVVDSLSSRH